MQNETAERIIERGDLALEGGAYDDARQAYEHALWICRESNDPIGEAACVLRLGYIAQMRAAYADAQRAYNHALWLSRQIGDVRGEAHSLTALGDLARQRSDRPAARQAFERALRLYRASDESLGEAVALTRLGELALSRSEYAEARQDFEEALAVYRWLRNPLGHAGCLFRLGEIALGRSEYATAQQNFEDAVSIYRGSGNALGEAACVLRLGDVSRERGEYDLARQAYEDASSLYQRLEGPEAAYGSFNCMSGLSILREKSADTKKVIHQTSDNTNRVVHRGGAIIPFPQIFPIVKRVPQRYAVSSPPSGAAVALQLRMEDDTDILHLINSLAGLLGVPEEDQWAFARMILDFRASAQNSSARRDQVAEARETTTPAVGEVRSEGVLGQPRISKVESVFGHIPREFRTRRQSRDTIPEDALHDPEVVQTAKDIVNANRRTKIATLEREARETLRRARRIVRANEGRGPT